MWRIPPRGFRDGFRWAPASAPPRHSPGRRRKSSRASAPRHDFGRNSPPPPTPMVTKGNSGYDLGSLGQKWVLTACKILTKNRRCHELSVGISMHKLYQLYSQSYGLYPYRERYIYICVSKKYITSHSDVYPCLFH